MTDKELLKLLQKKAKKLWPGFDDYPCCFDTSLKASGKMSYTIRIYAFDREDSNDMASAHFNDLNSLSEGLDQINRRIDKLNPETEIKVSIK